MNKIVNIEMDEHEHFIATFKDGTKKQCDEVAWQLWIQMSSLNEFHLAQRQEGLVRVNQELTRERDEALEQVYSAHVCDDAYAAGMFLLGS